MRAFATIILLKKALDHKLPRQAMQDWRKPCPGLFARKNTRRTWKVIDGDGYELRSLVTEPSFSMR